MHGVSTRKGNGIAVLVVFLLIIVSLMAWIVASYNKIPTLDEIVDEKFAQTQNTYKRRADLVPNLINTVKAYAKHEKQTLLAVVEARKQVSNIKIDNKSLSDHDKIKAFSQAQNNLSDALSKLLVVVERYPDLKSNENFLTLQSQLEGAENRIAVARRDYIKAVKDYNKEIRTFPGVFIAKMFFPDAKIKETFTITKKEQELPKVNFD